MRKAIVDAQGHLRLADWRQNDLVKGKEIPVDTLENSVVFPPGQTAANPIVHVAGRGDHLLIHTDKDWKPFPWLDAGKTRKAIAVLNHRFDLTDGLIIEGHIKAKPVFHGYRDASKSYAGFFIEGLAKGSGTGFLLEIGEPQWRESLIGRIQTEGSFHFESLDATGRASATVTGLDDGKDHTFRLWLRSGQMELYIDDLLMQSFFYFKATGALASLLRRAKLIFQSSGSTR